MELEKQERGWWVLVLTPVYAGFNVGELISGLMLRACNMHAQDKLELKMSWINSTKSCSI